jgi:chromosome segregation ATPase
MSDRESKILQKWSNAVEEERNQRMPLTPMNAALLASVDMDNPAEVRKLLGEYQKQNEQLHRRLAFFRDRVEYQTNLADYAETRLEEERLNFEDRLHQQFYEVSLVLKEQDELLVERRGQDRAIENLKAERTALRERVDRMEREREENRKSQKDLVGQAAERADHTQRLQQDIEEAQSQNECLRSELNWNKLQIEALNVKCEELEEEARNAGRLAASTQTEKETLQRAEARAKNWESRYMDLAKLATSVMRKNREFEKAWKAEQVALQSAAVEAALRQEPPKVTSALSASLPKAKSTVASPAGQTPYPMDASMRYDDYTAPQFIVPGENKSGDSLLGLSVTPGVLTASSTPKKAWDSPRFKKALSNFT